MKKLILIAIMATSFASCFSSLGGNKKIIITEDILTKDVSINPPASQDFYAVHFFLKEKVNCDIELGLFDVKEDSLIMNRIINLSDFIDDLHVSDMHFTKTVVKVLNPETAECTSLILEMQTSRF